MVGDDSSDLLDDFASTQQHLKDIKLAIEFKYLAKHAPGGVFIMPEIDNIRSLHGVIFIRRGLYRDGVFRFQMKLPDTYNDINTHPQIVFTPPIYNPLVDPETGGFDLRMEHTLKEWTPQNHFCVTALIFLKRAFYTKSYENYALPVANDSAREAFESDKETFLTNVAVTVKESLKRLYDEQGDACTLRFSRHLPAHDVLKEKIIAAAEVETAEEATGAGNDNSEAEAGDNGLSGDSSSYGTGAIENEDSNVTKKLFDSAYEVADEAVER